MEHEWFGPDTIIAVTTVAVFIATTVGAVWAVKADTKVLKTQIRVMSETMESTQKEIVELRKVLITLADHAGRMNLIDERLMMQGRRIDAIGQRVEQITADVNHRDVR